MALRGFTPASLPWEPHPMLTIMKSSATRNAIAGLLLLAACSSPATEAVTPPPPPAVASVSVSGSTSPLTVGATSQLVATPRDASGAVLAGRSVTWTTDAAPVATVSSTGLVTAIAPGLATITATSEGIAGSDAITVIPVAVASIVITAPKLAFLVGDASQYSAQPKDAQGNALTGRTVTWNSSQPSVVTVSSAGLVTAVGAGSATITATSETITANVAVTVALVPVASVTVTAATVSFVVGDVSQYSAQPKDAQGNPLSGRSITWASTQLGVATVSSTGLVTAVGVGSSSITASSEGVASAATVVTVAISPSLVEQRVLAQQGLAIALASTVLQSQLYTLLELVAQGNISGCVMLPGGGGLTLLTPTTVIPFQIGFYFDATCARIYMQETVTTFTADNTLGNFHIIANALYTGPTGTALGSIAFDEAANSIGINGSQLTGTVNGLGTYTSLAGAPSVRLGLNCNLAAPGHNVGICQGGVAQDFAGLSAAYGSVTTLALDSAATGALTLSGTSLLTSGALGALTLTQPMATSMVVNGGSTYGTTVDAGGAASFTLFPPTPTGWTVTDAAHDQVFAITVASNTVRNLIGTLKRISTGATLATIALDQSGTGTITYADNTTAPITSWMLSQ
jgi:trimeric autotransporter adhesin